MAQNSLASLICQRYYSQVCLLPPGEYQFTTWGRLGLLNMHDTNLTTEEQGAVGGAIFQPLTLKEFANKTIRSCLGFRRLEKARDLPLPTSLTADMPTLTIKDFNVMSSDWTGEHHSTNLMPAVCCLDGERVLLRVCEKDTPPPDDPAYILQFVHHETYCVQVFQWTLNLQERTEEWRENGERCPEELIWKVVEYLAMKAADIPPDANFRSSSVHFVNGEIFLRTPTHAGYLPIYGRNPRGNARTHGFYSPPEVADFRMRGRREFDQRTRSWTIGVLAYEMAALEPAFYDRAGNNNIFEVTSAIVNGLPPPPIRDVLIYSDELHSFIRDCTCHIQSRRPSLAEIQALARENLIRISQGNSSKE